MWNFNGPIVQNQAISAKYLKNASVKALNQPWTLWRKKISRVLYHPLSKYLPRRAKWAKKRIVQKCECNIFLSKVLRSQVGTKELFSTILFSTEISLKEHGWICIKIAHFWFMAWYNILRISPLFFRQRGVGNISILEF